MKTLVLKTPIRHGEEEITSVEVREPTAKDIRKIGFPFTGGTDISGQKIFDYAVELVGLPPSVIGQMSARDFTEISGIIANFFIDSGD